MNYIFVLTKDYKIKKTFSKIKFSKFFLRKIFFQKSMQFPIKKNI